MKFLSLFFVSFLMLGCFTKNNPSTDGEMIINQSISVHDPQNSWENAFFEIHIQEPRISNPYRYSIVKINNSTNTFELSRNRDEYISKHIINEEGESYVLLDDKVTTDSVLIKKYRLDPSRNTRYQEFYNMMYGLPMSLKDFTQSYFKTSEVEFNNELAYKIELELKKPIISEFWNIFIDRKTNEILGIEIIFPKDPEKGERIYFNETILLSKMKIPRIRNWHAYNDDIYSGTDVIVKSFADDL